MEATLTQILKAITNHPDDIVVTREEPSMGYVVLSVQANEEDKGHIIGKAGRTIKAIQDIIAVKAIKENKKVSIKIL